MYRYPFGQTECGRRWRAPAHAAPRADQTFVAPRDNTLPPHLLSAGGNLGPACPSALILPSGNELSRLPLEPRPNSGSGLGSRRRLPSISVSRGRLCRSRRARPSGDAKSMHSAVPPERLIRALEWGRGASTSVPNALDRVASPQPRRDLLLALHKTGVRLAIWSLHRPITDVGILAHTPLSVLETQSMFGQRIFLPRSSGDTLKPAATR